MQGFTVDDLVMRFHSVQRFLMLLDVAFSEYVTVVSWTLESALMGLCAGWISEQFEGYQHLPSPWIKLAVVHFLHIQRIKLNPCVRHWYLPLVYSEQILHIQWFGCKLLFIPVLRIEIRNKSDISKVNKCSRGSHMIFEILLVWISNYNMTAMIFGAKL